MSDRRHPDISSRKRPKQARANDLVSAVLEAALQVLAREGAQRFTTTRVAERAGVSVGSIYQYFPNKASILFRLQADEWQRTSALLRGILQDASRPPLARLRALVHAFVKSECEEAEIRVALDDAAPLYRDAPEAHAVRAGSDAVVRAFMRETLPEAKPAVRARAGELIKATFSAVGKSFSETPRSARQIAEYSDAMADMFGAYLLSLGHVPPAPPPASAPATARRRSAR